MAPAFPQSTPRKAKHQGPLPQPRITAATTAVVSFAGFILLVASWVFLHSGLYGEEISDLALYQRYGEAILDGAVPYRDFAMGYPPVAIPVFVLPALAAAEDYRGIFEFLMILSGEAALGFAVLTLRAAGVDRARLVGVAGFIGLAPLALGTVVLTRYDLWPAALTAAAIAALVAERNLLSGAVLAVAVAAKLYAIVLLPLALLYVARRSGIRAALAPLLIFVVAVAALTLPFAVGEGRLDNAAETQTIDRPLQIESLGSSILLAADQLGAYSASIVRVPGVQGLGGSLPDRLADVTTVLQVLAVALVWVLFWKGVASRERLLVACAAAVVAFITFGKVLSPQYLIWLIPLVPLVPGRRGIAAAGLLTAALLLTQTWFPSRYLDLLAFEDITWAVLARDLVLAALFVVLALGLRPSRAGHARNPDRSSRARVG